MVKKIIYLLIVILVIGFAIYSYTKNGISRIADIPNAFPESGNENTQVRDLSEFPAISTVAQNLVIPWSIDFLPDGKIIFTERTGKVSIIEKDGTITQILQLNVFNENDGEDGLLGIAVDPEFNVNNNVYLYYTLRAGEKTINRVSKFSLLNNSLTNETVIIDNIPGAIYHDGGRIKFGPDGYLYITTGDSRDSALAQDKNSLAGKILRVTRNGDPAPNNPFGSRIYSYGHRNPQGITWDDQGKLWATEHGRSGTLSGLDELNLIEPGKNYGWPEIQGDETKSGMETPIINSGPNKTWAPAGAAFYNGSIFFAGLRGQTLYEYKPDQKELVEHLKQRVGRIRDIVVGPDGFLYISTSNRDGRGTIGENDDKILKINPEKLSELN